MRKKLISLFLAMIFIFQGICITTFGKQEVRDIVLVLDNSGSMSGSAIVACKESAKKFCERVITADAGFRIGLVIFDTGVRKYEFTDNLSALKTNIDTMNASGGTNLYDAVETAKNMLVKSGAKNKNIVIMADGLPQHGKEQNSAGAYNLSDSDYYKQANAVYTLATSMHSMLNIYTLGFFHSLHNKKDRDFGIRFMKDIQNCGYYEAADEESLFDAFAEIVEVILIPPMEIELKNNHESTYSTKTSGLETKYDFRHVYKITASIKNIGTENADNTKTKIELAPGMVLDEGETTEKSTGTIKAGETKTVTWSVRIEHKAAESKYQYSVVTGADNAVAAEKFETIIVPAGISSKFFKDDEKYTFAHVHDNFSKGYFISDEDKKYLDGKLTNSEKTRIDGMLGNSFGGSCFGLTTVAILAKVGTLKPDLYVDGATSISQFGIPKSNPDVESLINFYHAMQKTDNYYNSIEDLKDSEDLKKLEKLIRESNVPPMVVFNWNKGVFSKAGHAVAAVSYENTTKENSPEGLDLKTYTKKIDIYDVNTLYSGVAETMFDLYYSSDYEKWTIPVYDANGFNFNIKNVTATTDDYNPYSLDDLKFRTDSERNKKALLLSNSLTEELIIKNSTGNYSTIGATEISGNIDIWSYYEAMVLQADDGTTYSPQVYGLPEVDDYSVDVKNATGDVGFALSYPNSTLLVKADTLDTIDFADEGEVVIKGSEGEFTLQSTYDEGHYTIPWHTFSVSGKDSAEVSLQLDEKGYILGGDNLKDITINAVGNNGTYYDSISATMSSILICMENGELTYYADLDKDGKYTNNVTYVIKPRTHMTGGLFGIIKGFFDFIRNLFGRFFNGIAECFQAIGEVIKEMYINNGGEIITVENFGKRYAYVC